MRFNQLQVFCPCSEAKESDFRALENGPIHSDWLDVLLETSQNQ